jgi:hypothetical protein
VLRWAIDSQSICLLASTKFSSGGCVAWVVWYEVGSSALGLRNNDQVFAAKVLADPTADGGFHWQAVGGETAGLTNPLCTSSAPPGFGPCAASTSAEDRCSLNANPAREAEDPSVASGTLTPGAATVPWVVWAEDTGSGKHGIFVGRLVGGNHFELFNGGAPVSPTGRDATNPDITFFGNVPYVSWVEARGNGFVGFVGHFVNGTFLLDTPRGITLVSPPRRASLIDFRVPISSSCTADPFTSDGAACPVAAVNSPFLTFTTATNPQALFGQAVPLGHHRRGRLKIRWNLKVNRHRLGPGKYLITLRALDNHRNVLGLTNPVIFTVKR